MRDIATVSARHGHPAKRSVRDWLRPDDVGGFFVPCHENDVSVADVFRGFIRTSF